MVKPVQPAQYMDDPRTLLERAAKQIEKVIVGKREMIDNLLTAFLAGGHVLLEDVPGVGKTMLARSFARSLDCEYRRIQFTPDLMPSDIAGTSVYSRVREEFTFQPGPIMTNLVLADELNRATPRTQAALLEAMEERTVSADGTTYELPRPFMVIATQNPLDYEGTYRLPEAQLDRFLFRLSLGYPGKPEENEMLSRLVGTHPIERVGPQLAREELLALQLDAGSVIVEEPVRRYIVDLACASRELPDVQLGVSPRGSFALMRAAQASAFLNGRGFVIPDDVKRVLPFVFGHRLMFTPEAAMRGADAGEYCSRIVRSVAVPTFRPAAG